jgi:hypothetical protein
MVIFLHSITGWPRNKVAVHLMMLELKFEYYLDKMNAPNG